MNFKEKLKKAQLNKTELSKRMGRACSHVSTWGDNPPKYVESYLEERIERLKLEIIVENLKKDIDYLK